tara:strand:+ start:153 stop:266 length:114 start_codon:yes stop_codon:yes gene_type:complete
MNPESLLVILPCWFVALVVELSVVYLIYKIVKEKDNE